MSEDTSLSRLPLVKLGIAKYNDWEKSMFARLMSLGVIGIVEGTEIAIPKPEPVVTGTGESAVTTQPTPEQIVSYNAYINRCYKAAGEIYMWLDDGNKIHVDFWTTQNVQKAYLTVYSVI